MNILDKCLKIEENPDLYNFKFLYKDTLLYPLIRFFLLQSAIEEMCNVINPYGRNNLTILNKIKYVLTSFFNRPQKARQADIIIFGESIANIKINGKYFNRLTETFANVYHDKTILIENSNNMKYYKYPREYSNVYSWDYIKIISIIRAIGKKIFFHDQRQIDNFILFLKNNFFWTFKNNHIWNEIKIKLIRYVKILPFLTYSYKRLLKQISPKLILVGAACYGGGYTPLIMAGKELNIPIGEYQHGIITLLHPAYNYSNKLQSVYLSYMPDFFLCYGIYWQRNMNLPIKNVLIGNPYLTEISSNYKKNKKETILYISSAAYPDLYINSVLYLHKMFENSNYKVIFRIHPCEYNIIETIYKPIKNAEILIDTAPLYDTLTYSKFVIGEISTVLYEAIMFNCIIFVQNTPYNNNLDLELFNNFLDLDDLVNKIHTKKYKLTKSDEIWESNWCEKYKKLIEKYSHKEVV